MCPANSSTAPSHTTSTPEGPKGTGSDKRKPALAPRAGQRRKDWYRAKTACELPKRDSQAGLQAGPRCPGRGRVSPASHGGDHRAPAQPRQYRGGVRVRRSVLEMQQNKPDPYQQQDAPRARTEPDLHEAQTSFFQPGRRDALTECKENACRCTGTEPLLKSLQDLPACCDQTLKSRAVTKQNKHKLSALSSARHPATCPTDGLPPPPRAPCLRPPLPRHPRRAGWGGTETPAAPEAR